MNSVAKFQARQQQFTSGAISLRPEDAVDDPEWDDYIVSVQGRRCLADVVAEKVDWLWEPYIPLCHLTIIEGDPGLGKSWLSLGIATGVSLGRGLPNVSALPPRNVLLLSCEDSLAATIRPRLDSMRADANRVWAIDDVATFEDDGLRRLEAHIVETAAALVIVDPFVAYFGSGDLNRANQTRKVMSALADIAERQHCAIVLIRHLTKGARDKSIYRGQGNIGITAACRSALLVGADPDDRNKRAMAHIKCNLAPLGPTISYSIETGRFTWAGISDLTPERILAAEGQDDGRKTEAVQFLRELLSNGPMRKKDIDEQATGAGIAKATLRRAKRALHVVSTPSRAKTEKGAPIEDWVWCLP